LEEEEQKAATTEIINSESPERRGSVTFRGEGDGKIVVERRFARLLAAKRNRHTDCYPGELSAEKLKRLKELKAWWLIMLSAIQSRSA